MEDVIKKAIKGDEKAFEKLMINYLQDIYNYISIKVNNENDINDIIQETMLAVFEGLRNYQFTSSFKTWVLAITRRKIADFYRNKYATTTLPLENCPHIQAKEYKDIYEIIGHLPDDDQELLNLIFVQRLSYKEISQILNIPIGTIKSRFYYLKEKLKPQFKEEIL